MMDFVEFYVSSVWVFLGISVGIIIVSHVVEGVIGTLVSFRIVNWRQETIKEAQEALHTVAQGQNNEDFKEGVKTAYKVLENMK